MENVAEFLENIDNNLTYYEIPTQLACAYLKGHLTGRAIDWVEVLGYRVVEDKATDYAQLKQALTEQFPLDTQNIKTRNDGGKLPDHVISRLEPQILDYVEVRYPQTTSNLLQIIDKYEERFIKKRSEVRIGNSEIQTQSRTIVSLTGIGKKIEGRREVTTYTRTIADHGGCSIDLRVKVLRIIGYSMVDAELVNLIIDSTFKAVDKVVRGTVLSGVRMIKTDT
ncbi:uncharacterized protein TNCV_2877161 [Trichonephila clavipes]|uniref:Uncharacterized protein n=1 Tax=Trichonephila clavipes TaxID=2585209 RepID=A0A8X6WE89_TRICX|nr:uncharacterized protein TNCV_2877161 [Trichonephila clavipes]